MLFRVGENVEATLPIHCRSDIVGMSSLFSDRARTRPGTLINRAVQRPRVAHIKSNHPHHDRIFGVPNELKFYCKLKFMHL